jgi:hypothetical protein
MNEHNTDRLDEYVMGISILVHTARFWNNLQVGSNPKDCKAK